ncbi:MAG: DUF4350 domain-containing protein [Acidimicrobiia bacterium]|nr:DUF4350 domain-containing protein [Acidimicrobiia bacterium]
MSKRVWIGVAVFLGLAVLLNLVGLLADRLAGGEVVPGPDGSSYVTTTSGWAAYHDLLAATGHEVERLEEPIRPGVLDPATTLVLAQPDSFAVDTRQADLIAAFLADGGRLVLASTSFFGDLGTSLVDPPPVFGGVPPSRIPAIPVAEGLGIEQVATSGLYSWSDTGAAVPLVGADGISVVAAATVGDGRLIHIADPAVLSNGLIGEADNAALGIALAGGTNRTIVFNEYVHGYGGDSLISALPDRWGTTLVLAVLALLTWMWAIGARFIPAEPESREFPPSRGLYVDALAASIARSPGGPTEGLRAVTSRDEDVPVDPEDPVALATALVARTGRHHR